MSRKYAARTDDNHAEIVQAFRSLYCSVQDLSTVGSGVPDLLIGRCGRNRLVEVKDGSKPPSACRLTPDQQKWHLLWRGEVDVVYNVGDVERLVAKWIEEDPRPWLN